jgi:hypothetical protein
MKQILPYLLTALVVALVLSTLNLSKSKKQPDISSPQPTNSLDSLMKEEQKRRQIVREEGNGIDFFSIGIRKMEKTGQYFLRLGEYYREPGISFTIENGNYVYRYPDRIAGAGIQRVNYREEITLVRYAYDPFLEENFKGSVLIPISKGDYTILSIITLLLFLASVILFLYFGFYNIIRILLDISRGKGFTHKNTLRLYVAGYTFLFVPLIPLLLIQVANWYFSASIPSGLSYSFLRSIREGYWNSILIGTIVLITAFAFEKGTRIKRELDTVA